MNEFLIILFLALVCFCVYSFLGKDNNKADNSSPNKLSDLETKIMNQIISEEEELMLNNLNDSSTSNNEDNISLNTLDSDNSNNGNNRNGEDIIRDENNNIVNKMLIINKTIDERKHSTPENIQHLKMKEEKSKSDLLMEKNIPYLDLDNDLLNISLLPKNNKPYVDECM